MSEESGREIGESFDESIGRVINQKLQEFGWTQAELARRMGRSKKYVNALINDHIDLTPGVAIELERVTDISAARLNLLALRRRVEVANRRNESQLCEQVAWMRRFPIEEMLEFGWISVCAEDEVEKVAALLRFFKVASVVGWKALWGSEEDVGDRWHLAAWLNQGELEVERFLAGELAFRSYNRKVLRFFMYTHMKYLSMMPDFVQVVRRLTDMCARAGVIFVVVPMKPNFIRDGVVWWARDGRPVIQMGAEFEWDGLFWVALYRLLNRVIRENKTRDCWDVLVNHWKYMQISRHEPLSEALILAWADTENVAPGWIITHLQNRRKLPRDTPLNKYKNSYYF